MQSIPKAIESLTRSHCLDLTGPFYLPSHMCPAAMGIMPRAADPIAGVAPREKMLHRTGTVDAEWQIGKLATTWVGTLEYDMCTLRSRNMYSVRGSPGHCRTAGPIPLVWSCPRLRYGGPMPELQLALPVTRNCPLISPLARQIRVTSIQAKGRRANADTGTCQVC